MKRLNLELSDRVYDKVQRLKDRLDAGSITEAIRRAVSVTDKLLAEQERGSVLVVRDLDGVETQVVLA